MSGPRAPLGDRAEPRERLAPCTRDRHIEDMVFADLKNDFVFQRVFAKRPDILAALLNDLLDRRGERTIESIEYLPPQQLPLAAGAKLSILDVRCRDRAGTTFVVEMQLLHVPGFVNRVVYNACKAYVDQLGRGEPYTRLADVVAVSICDFVLWPDAEQDTQGKPRVPMLSRWNMTERGSGNHDLLQVQYAFLELPKLPAGKPRSGAELWAWLFVHTPDLTEVPPELPPGPHRAAMELANEATFSAAEVDAYRKVMDEIQQVRDYGEAKLAAGFSKGEAAGFSRGEAAGFSKGEVAGFSRGEAAGRAGGKAEAVLAVLRARGLAVDDEARARIAGCTDAATLDGWIACAVTVGAVAELFDGAS